MLIKEKNTARTDILLDIFGALEVNPEIKEKFRSSITQTIELEHTIEGKKYYLPFEFESNGEDVIASLNQQLKSLSHERSKVLPEC